MTALAWTLTGLLTAAVVASLATTVRIRHRFRDADRRIASLAERLAAIDATSRQALHTARAAETAARCPPAHPDDGPRVVLEPLTGRLVKAVALGAGARRAVTRLARGSGRARS